MTTTEPSNGDDLEQRVAFEAIRGRLFGELGQPVSIGRFLVTRRLGQGGMGVVYEAYDPQLDRRVAVKVLRDVGDDAHAAKARRSLEREARAAAGLSHPNVVTVYDSGAVGSGFYVAMELVEGSTLRKWLEVPRKWPELVRMFIAAGHGLQAAHDAGLIHCDFKPDNVLVGADGRPRVVDFGLVRWMEAAAAEGPTASQASLGTGAGTVRGGTPAYMPPEQFEGHPEARTDQYAFCVALYRALFGEHPYVTPRRLARAHERTRVPRGVVRAILKGLARDVEQRHGSMQALIDRLQQVLRRRARLPWALAGVMLTGLAAGAGSALTGFDPCERAGAEIEAVWTGEARAAVVASLAAAGDPGQAEALARRLDEHARDWGEMSRESCEATHARGEQSGELLELRTACLGRHRNTFEHTVARLQGLSAGQGEAGRMLVERLPPVGGCAADRLRARIGFRGTDRIHTDRSRSAEANAAFLDIVDLLDRARSEELLGTRRDALVLAAQAEARASDMGLRYLEAEAIELRVSLEVGEGRVSGAEAELRRALALAVEADDPVGAAQVVYRLLTLDRLGAKTVAGRSLLATLGRAWAARTPRPVTLIAQIDYEEACAAQERGDHTTALALIGGARAALADAGLADDTVALKLRTIEGRSFLDTGRLEDAERELGELLAIQRARLPRQHADLADTMFFLADALLALGKPEEALPLAQQAWEIYRERRGDGDPSTLRARQVVARAWWRQGDPSRAAVELTATIDTIVRTHGPFHALAFDALIDLAELEHEAGELSRARIHALLARITARESFGPEHVLTSACGITVGKVAIDLGELALAHTMLTEARLRVDETFGPIATAEVAHQLARLALRGSPPDPERARALSDEALVRLRRVPGDAALRLMREITEWRRRPHDPRIE